MSEQKTNSLRQGYRSCSSEMPSAIFRTFSAFPWSGERTVRRSLYVAGGGRAASAHIRRMHWARHGAVIQRSGASPIPLCRATVAVACPGRGGCLCALPRPATPGPTPTRNLNTALKPNWVFVGRLHLLQSTQGPHAPVPRESRLSSGAPNAGPRPGPRTALAGPGPGHLVET